MIMDGKAALVVVKPGLNTTIQDRGRMGWQRFGVPVSGALDRVALAAANVVVGNGPWEAAIECLYQGCEVEIAGESARVAVAGTGVSLEVVDQSGSVVGRFGGLESVRGERGWRINVKIAGPSIAGYLAVEGGLAIQPMLGSRSTYVRAALGGLAGRALQAGDRVVLAQNAARERQELCLTGVDLGPVAKVRVIAGPQHEAFEPEALELLEREAYCVTGASDRMGLRLSGPRLKHRVGADIVSDGIAPGAIQVPGDGLPIVMLADRQTTGGYTKIATVISSDLPALGRVGPGAQVRFEFVSVEAGEELARAQAREIRSWPERLAPAGGTDVTLVRLYHANLISGVVDGDVGR